MFIIWIIATALWAHSPVWLVGRWLLPDVMRGRFEGVQWSRSRSFRPRQPESLYGETAPAVGAVTAAGHVD